MEEPKESTDGSHDGIHTGVQLPVYLNEPDSEGELAAHHYDASKYERPSVTVDVLMMSLRQRDLQILLIKRRSWNKPYVQFWTRATQPGICCG